MYSIYINPVIVKLFGNKTLFDISAEKNSHIAIPASVLVLVKSVHADIVAFAIKNIYVTFLLRSPLAII